MSLKSHGKLAFAKIRDHSGTIQVCFMRDTVKFDTGRDVVESIELSGETKSAYKIAEKFTQVGDYI
jgi:lysyl-tRNA synthetase class II